MPVPRLHTGKSDSLEETPRHWIFINFSGDSSVHPSLSTSGLERLDSQLMNEEAIAVA